MATETLAGETAATGRGDATRPADVLVVFGITGDLAKVMTFQSLYRLEARGLLRLPDRRCCGRRLGRRSTAQALPASAIEATRRDDRPGGVRPPRGAASYVPATSPTPTPTSRVAAAIGGAERPGVLPGDPAVRCSRTVIKGLTEAGLTENGRVVVEKPFGHDLESARALAAELHQYLDESQLYRIDHFLGQDGPGGAALPPLRQHDAGAGLEPELRRVGADHDGRELRRRGSRPLLRPGRRPARRGRQPPDAGGRGGRDGGARPAATPKTLKDAQVALFRVDAAGRSGALRARAVRRLPGDRRGGKPTPTPRPTPRCGWTSTTGAGRASRSSSGPASDLPVTQTELRLVFKHPPRLGLRDRAGGQLPEPDQLVVKLDPTHRHPDRLVDAQRADTPGPEPITLDMEFADAGRRGPDALRGAAAGRDEW